MKLSIAKDKNIELEELDDFGGPTRHGRQFNVNIGKDSARLSNLINTAVKTHFEMPDYHRLAEGGRRAAEIVDKIRPAFFREVDSGLLRVVYKEISLQFKEGVNNAMRKRILEHFGLEVRNRSKFNRHQYTVFDPTRQIMAQRMVELSNQIMELEEIEAAGPNFVSEFPRQAVPHPAKAQWHLNHRSGDIHNSESDVEIRNAWKLTMGSPDVVISILDDGVDVEHPNLRENIVSRPDPNEPRDVVGRDFFIPDDTHPEHFNPRAKRFQFPYERMPGNDIHGTPCAGVAAAAGRMNSVYGAAPKCKILPVKVFHADDLASESRVADAIAYAATFSDILSCSWSGPNSAVIEAALGSVAKGQIGDRRAGLGTPVFVATGNDGQDWVSYPATSDHTIGIGATTDAAQVAGYSNRGPEVWNGAPSSGGTRSIMTTDVGIPNRGFNIGDHAAGGSDGFHTNSFGGTSSATPLAAGIAGLLFSLKRDLSLDELKNILRDTADKIGSGYTGTPSHSPAYGRINAESAVKAVVQLLPSV